MRRYTVQDREYRLFNVSEQVSGLPEGAEIHNRRLTRDKYQIGSTGGGECRAFAVGCGVNDEDVRFEGLISSMTSCRRASGTAITGGFSSRASFHSAAEACGS